MRRMIATILATRVVLRWYAMPVLLAACCPSAISGLVVPIVIWEAVETVSFRGTLSHVSEEVLEGVSPAVAYRDASPPVAVEPIRARVVAAGLHRGPGGIRKGSSASVGCDAFDVKAAAAFVSTGFQVVGVSNAFLTAVTQTAPCGFSTLFTGECYNKQPSKPLTFEVYKSPVRRFVHSRSYQKGGKSE